MSQAIQKAVEKYIAIRDEKKRIQDLHKAELRPLNDALQSIENAVHKVLINSGGDSVKTPSGTAYLSTTTRPQIADWTVLRPFILENDLIDMMIQKLTPSAVEEYASGYGELPPGVIVASETFCRFKR